MCHATVAGAKSVHPSQCAARPMACDKCHLMIPFNQHASHIESTCNGVIIACTVIHGMIDILLLAKQTSLPLTMSYDGFT
jgi:hypothetical protein